MSDAWTVLIANAEDTTDAWAALNSQRQVPGGGIPGLPVDELKFTLAPIINITGAIVTPTPEGSVEVIELSSNMASTSITGSVQGSNFAGTIEVGDI